MDRKLERKLADLRKRIKKLDSVLVAYSGGIDSSLLLRICREELGEQAVAVTNISEDYPSSDLALARSIAKVIDVRHITVEGKKTKEQDYTSLKNLASKMNIKNVLVGSHKDDVEEASKHFLAAKKSGVKSPLADSGLTKNEIKFLSNAITHPRWKRTKTTKKHEDVQKLFEKYSVKKAKLIARGKNTYIYANKKELVIIAKHLVAIQKKLEKLGFSNIALKLS